jgi:hypothetical protein
MCRGAGSAVGAGMVVDDADAESNWRAVEKKEEHCASAHWRDSLCAARRREAYMVS